MEQTDLNEECVFAKLIVCSGCRAGLKIDIWLVKYQ